MIPVHLVEAAGHLGIVAGHHQPGGAGEGVDAVEALEHLGQARDELHRVAALDVAVGVRRTDRP